MSPTDDDHVLVRDVADGDQKAFNLLVNRHAAAVRALAVRFTGNDADADEIVQDVFFKVWSHARGFDPAKAGFSTWLYRIATNRCFDALRRRKRRTWFGLDDVDDPPAPDPSAETTLSDRQNVAAVRADILELPERQRMALLLVVTDERTAQDVADTLGVSKGAAEQLIVRARQTLRERQRARQGEK